MTNPLLTIEVRSEGETTRVAIAGVVDETASFGALDEVRGPVEINAAKVRRLSSMGVWLWADAMRALGQRGEITFVECSRAVIQQVSMISGFLGRGTVASFYVPMHCDACDHELDHLLTTVEYRRLRALPPIECPACHATMQLDELEAVYLQFLRDSHGGAAPS